MPWKNVTSMEEIIRFVTLAQTDRFTITDLCEQFGISRETAYKHLERYALGGFKALQPRSHRPHHSQRTAAEVEALILAERRRHRTWGPKKLQVILETRHGLEGPRGSCPKGLLPKCGTSSVAQTKAGYWPIFEQKLLCAAENATPPQSYFGRVGLGNTPRTLDNSPHDSPASTL